MHEDKAEAAGDIVVSVDPRYTSQRCSAWKYLALGKSEARRPSVNLPVVAEGALHLSPASPRL
jgi:hypothetical protein